MATRSQLRGIVAAVKALLETIGRDPDLNWFTAPATVLAAPDAFVQALAGPALVLTMPSETFAPSSLNGLYDCELRLTLFCISAYEPTSEEAMGQLCDLIGDVKHALANDPQLGSGSSALLPGGWNLPGEVTYDVELSAACHRAAAVMTLNAKYRWTKDNP